MHRGARPHSGLKLKHAIRLPGKAERHAKPQTGSLDRLWRLQKQAEAGSEKDTQSLWRSERALRALMDVVLG